MRQVLVIVALIIGFGTVATVFMARRGVANVVGSGQTFTEKSAVSTLRTLHWAQGDFRRAAFVDEDGDGIGEFGTVAQLTATAPLPSGGKAPVPLIQIPGAEVRDGVLVANGYCFRTELPADPDGRERRFAAAAWPLLPSAGKKAFCLNQDEEIFESANEQGWFGCEKGPPPGACPTAAMVDAGGSGWTRWRGKTSTRPVGHLD